MPRCSTLAIHFAATAAAFAQAELPEWAQPIPTTDNAALYYWQAFALLPRWTKAQQAIVDQPEAAPLDSDDAKEAFAASHPAMQAVHRAGALLRCEWGTNWDAGPTIEQPHIARARELARLARFRVMFQEAQGQLDRAVDDGLAICRMARHMTRSGNIDGLIGGANDAVGTYTLALLVPRLSPDQLRGLARRHAALPKAGALRDVVVFEKRLSAGWFTRMVSAGRTAEVIAALNSPLFAADKDAVSRLQEEMRSRPEALAERLKRTAADFDAAAEMIDLAPDEFDKRWQELALRASADTPSLTLLVLPGLEQLRANWRRIQVRHAMLQAGIAYRLMGDEGLERHPDPTVDKPFQMQSTSTGFELRSHLPLFGNGPMFIRFGQPAPAK